VFAFPAAEAGSICVEAPCTAECGFAVCPLHDMRRALKSARGRRPGGLLVPILPTGNARHPDVSSWGITKPMGPMTWSYFHFFVILDNFSRRVVGWRVADPESATLFRPLFRTLSPNKA
jgi:transposase InsO family protein